ncbi:HIT family protein [Lederbergia galactosidilytica]|uniref:HIT family hydrolase n=1 Tax=Lederbergia galactosidilytica TaxID=217031 RepID=A0A0Q9Y3R7_9BACI|nr:HIT domain-containing protein [Lederbergia galactosidilytica]KRG11502.1 HIT family hydrolase [Lederbergia galactosidilytica]OAK68238.1 HIT family hydrolase [Lederbergia galactosidilytica]
MTSDFYCDEVLSGNTQVEKVYETENVLAYYHTKPFYEIHIVAIPKKHIPSLTTIEDQKLLLELMGVVQKVATKIEREHGACRVITNLGAYQDSKHLHWHIAFGEKVKIAL